jgi:hypothetical protein
MRWGIIPGWWNKPLKEMRLATFNARAQIIEDAARLIEAWNARQLGHMPMVFSPTMNDDPSVSVATRGNHRKRRICRIIAEEFLRDEMSIIRKFGRFLAQQRPFRLPFEYFAWPRPTLHGRSKNIAIPTAATYIYSPASRRGRR